MKRIFIFPLLTIFLLGFAGISGGAPINQVDYGSLTGTGLITFDDILGGASPGTNYNAILNSNGAAFGERFLGQALSTSGDFDILSGSPTGYLSLAAGDPNRNLNVLIGGNSQVLSGLGPNEYPNYNAIGEGSLGVLFDYDQSELGFRVIGGQGGTAYISFFRRDGSLIETVTLSGLSNAGYGFQREGGIYDIAGISIYNNDPGGVGFDDLKHDVPVPEPSTMLLLGSGLIGLIGFRKKFKR